MRRSRAIPLTLLWLGLSADSFTAGAQEVVEELPAPAPARLPTAAPRVPVNVAAPERPTPAEPPLVLEGPVFKPARRGDHELTADELAPSAEILPLEDPTHDVPLVPAQKIPATAVREKISERYASGAIKLEREMVQDAEGNYLMDGAWRLFSEKGQLLSEGDYVADERHGIWRRIHGKNDSALFASSPYNTFQAPFTSEATFQNGKLHGVWTILDAKNRKVSEIHFESGRRHGPAIWWQANGTPLMQSQFVDGELHGESFTLDGRGQPTSRVHFDRGWKVETVTEKFKTGKMKSEATMLTGQWKLVGDDDWWNARPAKFNIDGSPLPHGKRVTYHANGQTHTEAEFERGKPIGRIVSFHENGLKAMEGNYDDGLAVGQWTWWAASGLKSIEGEFVAGKEEGTWTWWNEQGKIARRGPFETAPSNDRPSVGPPPREQSVAVGGGSSPTRLGAPRPTQ